MCFPIGAVIFELVNTQLPFSFGNIIYIHSTNNLLYMIDSAPVFLGLFALLGGISHQRSSRLLKEFKNLSKQLIENSNKLEHDAKISMKVIQNNLVKVKDLILSHSSINDQLSEAFIQAQDNTQGMNNEVQTIEERLENILSKSNQIEKQYESMSALFTTFTNNIDQIKSTYDQLYNLRQRIDILAVNSGIEASKLGKAGSTFGVVSKNIRELSVKADEVNVNLNILLETINEGVEKLMKGMGNGMEMSKEVFQVCRLIEDSINNYLNVSDIFKGQLLNITQINQYESAKRKDLESTLKTINNENQRISDEIQSIVDDELVIIEKIKSFEKVKD